MIKKIILSVLIGIVSILIIFAQVTFVGVLDNTNSDYSDIFRRINKMNNHFGDMPVTKVAMLGSHDSMSDNISYLSKPDVTREKNNRDNVACNPFAYLLAKGAVVRIAKTQSKNVYEQMKAGSRYLDVRITDIDSEYYTAHGLISDTLDNNIILLLKFLDENPGEFVIVNILFFYQEDRSWDELCDYISSIKYNSKNMFDYINYENTDIDLSQITYNVLTNNGSSAGILLVSSKYDGVKYSNYFFTENIINPCLHEPDYKKINEEININVSNYSEYDEHYLKINQTQVTPNAEGILGVLANWSLISISDKHNIEIIENEDYEEWFKNMPIYLSDNVTSNKSNFNRIINDSIIQYNLLLAEEY